MNKLEHKKKKRKKGMESILNNKIYKRAYSNTEYDLLISPIVRNINIVKQGIFMNFAINVQLLIAAFYFGNSGDSLGFIAGSFDLPGAQLIQQNNYRHSDELSQIS